MLPHAEHPHREWPYRRPIAMRYGIAVLIVLVAFSMRHLVYGDLNNRLAFTFFVPAAIVAVWYGGLGPGMLATIFGLVMGAFFFLPPRDTLWSVSSMEVRGISIYAGTTVLCVVLCENLHHWVRRLEHALELERRHHDAESQPLAHGMAAAAEAITHRGRLSGRTLAARYGVAVGVVIVAFALRYWTFPAGDHRLPFIFFTPAAIIATWYGGMGPGLLAAAGGLMLGDYFFLSEHEAMGPVRETERLAIGLYAVATTLCVMLFEYLHNRIRRLEHALEHARQHHKPHTEIPAESALSH